MASGLNIHIDKENAVPSFVPKNKGVFIQTTPRKALYDVNKDTTKPVSLKGEGFVKPSADNLPMRKKTSTHPANSEPPKLSLQENKNFLKKEVNPSQRPQSANASKSKKKVPKKPDPVPDDEDGYDSDTIWPRAERLSSHIHNILTWRPSCLLGNEGDSDSSSSEDELPDQIIIEKPAAYDPFMHFPDVDMASILASLPDPENPYL